jgi:hypothetical protein
VLRYFIAMSVKEIENAIKELPVEALSELRDWFEDYCEDKLELKDEVKAKVQMAREDIAAGRYRTRRP